MSILLRQKVFELYNERMATNMEYEKNPELKYEKEAQILKALAHPVRLCIVKGLVEKGGCNVLTMCDILGISQSNVSQHLTKLKAAGIVKGIRKGNEICYGISDKLAEKVICTLFSDEKHS
jgi:ArsR family transcriptional regulator